MDSTESNTVVPPFDAEIIMNAELEPPTTESTADTTTDSATALEAGTFPYSGGDRGAHLPAPRSLGRLESSGSVGSDGRPGSTACPACDGATINGVGLFACTECDWTGSLR